MQSGTIIRARLRAASGRPEAQLLLAEELERRGAGPEAVQRIAAAAREGLAEAQTRLGLRYLHGHGVPASLAEARHWLERAAEADDVPAQTLLAKLALNGVSGPYQRGAFATSAAAVFTEPDHQRAADLARRAADAGSAEAQALLATILCVAPSAAKPGDDADALFREAALAGSPLGQLGHAMALLQEDTEDARCQAHDLLSAAAEAGLPTAHFMLGAMAEAGTGGDPGSAVGHYRTAAEHGHGGAKTRLGLALLVGRGTRQNLVEAETWLRRAANNGDAQAAAVLGHFHANPEWQPANLSEAARWFRVAAELGHPGVAHVLARVIAAGGEGEPDVAEIAAWLKTAIEGGETAAWPVLGGLIASASVPPDHLPALHGWLQRMIREERPEAGYYVGVCVNCGIGTHVDEALARRYYLWAAGEGVIEAMVAAGEMLLNGRGGPADPDLARSLFAYAGERDHAGATYALGIMAGTDRDAAMTHFRRAAALGHPKAKLLASCDPVMA